MQNLPEELTQLIEPTELYVVDRLAHSLEVQSTVIKEIQQQVQAGRTACFSDAMVRFHRLSELHRQLLDLHDAVAKLGDGLYKWSNVDQSGIHLEDDVPF